MTLAGHGEPREGGAPAPARCGAAWFQPFALECRNSVLRFQRPNIRRRARVPTYSSTRPACSSVEGSRSSKRHQSPPTLKTPPSNPQSLLSPEERSTCKSSSKPHWPLSSASKRLKILYQLPDARCHLLTRTRLSQSVRSLKFGTHRGVTRPRDASFVPRLGGSLGPALKTQRNVRRSPTSATRRSRAQPRAAAPPAVLLEFRWIGRLVETKSRERRPRKVSTHFVACPARSQNTCPKGRIGAFWSRGRHLARTVTLVFRSRARPNMFSERHKMRVSRTFTKSLTEERARVLYCERGLWRFCGVFYAPIVGPLPQLEAIEGQLELARRALARAACA